MFDAWVAECIPCNWGEHFPTQDQAIAAAEEHVNTLHLRVRPELRGQQKIGHVQQRTLMTQVELMNSFVDVQTAAIAGEPVVGVYQVDQVTREAIEKVLAAEEQPAADPKE